MATMGYMHNTCEQSLPKEREEEEEKKEESRRKETCKGRHASMLKTLNIIINQLPFIWVQ